ncbi:hypothetical protein NDU88_011700 [Pleurodeles waltl]|uniref:Uncharacterized protein n=1 Tax=Pleurodeles waltl TaxID=8319 RepID=A0AAV7S4B2_PLEWA|nr:hypothetical protein NDU88_011700 [Pleurodeles waltl]
MSPLGGGDRGGAQQLREPSQKQAAPAEVPEQALGRRVNRSPRKVTKWSPTTPEDNSEGCTLQDRVSGPRLGCSRRKYWKSAQEPEQLQITRYPAMQSSVGRQGLTSTKLGLKSHWTVGVTWTELLSSRDHARQDDRGPRGPVLQSFGACVSRGKIPSTHGRFLQSAWCRVKAGYPQSMHHLETVEKAAG